MKLNWIFFIITLLTSPVNVLSNLENNKKLIELNENNTIVLKGTINSDLISNIIHKSNNLISDDIIVFISSPGGSVMSGNNFIEFIKSLEQRGKKISCIAETAISMAFVILQACPTRYILDSSVVMQHQMSLGVNGKLENIKSRLVMIKDLNEQIIENQAKRLELSVDDFKKKTISDWWLYGSSIIKNKVADEIVNVYCSNNLLGDKNVEEKVFNTILGKFKLIYSKCPLAKNPLNIKMMDEKAEKNKNTILKHFR